jgi:hypothetical protein
MQPSVKGVHMPSVVHPTGEQKVAVSQSEQVHESSRSSQIPSISHWPGWQNAVSLQSGQLQLSS